MQDYWNRSWQNIAPERIQAYADSFDAQPDEIIRLFQSRCIKKVCDAGCGCGIYALVLARNGFVVHGFDVAQDAVNLADSLFESSDYTADIKCASVLATGYESDLFDGVICRDVLDHMHKKEAANAIQELLRITKPGGLLFLTLDALDDEYQNEPHIVNADGDYVFTDGKWSGMIFHPYAETEILQIIPGGIACRIRHSTDGFTALLEK